MIFRVTKSIVFYFILTLAFCTVSFAADGVMKVGIMDIQKIMTQSQPGMKAKAVLEEKQEELRVSLAQDQKAAEILQQEIEKMSSVWSQEKKDEKMLEFNKMRRDLQTKSKDSQLELKRMQERELAPILKALEGIVKEYGAENKFDLILDSRSGVLYFKSSLDVSSDLIKEIDANVK